jgi:3-oxoacyl-[acyl-carrier protein] reductase
VKPLSGRTALVTGGSRGIGAGVARCLARDGADIAIVYRRDTTAAEAVAQQLRTHGRAAVAVRADIGDPGACTRAAETASDALGRIDILVHCAGRATRGQLVADTPADEFATAYAEHCLGAAYLAAALLPGMRVARRADIVLITSAIPAGGRPRIAPYAMAKAAAEALARTLAHEEREHGVRVNVVRPGFTATEMGRRLLLAAAGHDDFATVAPSLPFGQVGTPDDIGELVAFLVSERAARITNQVVEVDGGQSSIDVDLELA